MKPENILLKQYGHSNIKVIDFGSSCFENQKLYTYIQSRFYRAPEILLGMTYGIEIDMWSFGCIITELYTGIPIFPGENEKEQIGYIMEYIGVPSDNVLEVSRKKSRYFDSNNAPLGIPNSRGKVRLPNTKKFSKFLKGADESFIDLIKKCLEWNPEKRIKPDEAILHPWIKMALSKDSQMFYKNNLKSRLNSNIYSNSKSNCRSQLNSLNTLNVVPSETLRKITNTLSSDGVSKRNESEPKKNMVIGGNFESSKSKLNCAADVNYIKKKKYSTIAGNSYSNMNMNMNSNKVVQKT